MEPDTLLRLQDLCVSYGDKECVKNVSLELKRGEIFVIAGESGSGKSTILKAVQGTLGMAGRVNGGSIFFCGRDITHIDERERRGLSGTEISMIFQNPGASFCPIRTIGDQIYEAARAHNDWSDEGFTARAVPIMKSINLEEGVLSEYPFRLSGGMGQRAGILAAMILSPKLLLADEPTSALDTVTQVSVVKELMALRDRLGISILMVTHHMGIAFHMADYILIMRRGEMVEWGTREEIFNAPKKGYTMELIASVPRMEV